jgi:hypothetical protein
LRDEIEGTRETERERERERERESGERERERERERVEREREREQREDRVEKCKGGRDQSQRTIMASENNWHIVFSGAHAREDAWQMRKSKTYQKTEV